MAKKRYHSDGHEGRTHMMKDREYYAGHAGRMRQEHEDGDMLHDDRSALANMPQHIIMKEYPMSYGYLPEKLDDSIRGVDELIGKNDSKRNQHLKPKKN